MEELAKNPYEKIPKFTPLEYALALPQAGYAIGKKPFGCMDSALFALNEGWKKLDRDIAENCKGIKIGTNDVDEILKYCAVAEMCERKFFETE
jgi:hypothetical protein